MWFDNGVLIIVVVLFFFFFSSRRRHTRCGRDWSSDVCSSDLALGLTLLGIDLFFAVPANPEPSTWLSLMTEPVYIRVLLDLVGIGICGGLFIVPLYAFIQYETPDHKRARIIAALNVINSLFMVASAIAGILVLGVFDLGIPTFFLILSLVNALVWVSVLGLRRRAAQSVDN